MSILIPNIKMPKSCNMCWALDDYGDYPRCRITDEQRGYNFNVRGQRMTKCPLIEVTSHGRLINVDELMEHKMGVITAFHTTDLTERIDLCELAQRVVADYEHEDENSCLHYRSKNEEMQEVANKDAFYREMLND